MTKREREIVLRAAELIERIEETHCCIALVRAGGRDLLGRFGRFYDKFHGLSWTDAWNEDDSLSWEQLKEIRVLALLTFAELG